MKRIVVFLVLFVNSVVMFGKRDVTRFMGIPVDGTKSEMLEKLKANGFASFTKEKDILQGECDGRMVNVYLETYHDKVWQVVVADVYTLDGEGIKERFNGLCEQFSSDPDYFGRILTEDGNVIPDSVDVETMMSQGMCRAIYVYKCYDDEGEDKSKELNDYFLTKYTQNEIDSPTNEIEDDMETMKNDYYTQFISRYEFFIDIVQKSKGNYFILMRYVNKCNNEMGKFF